MVGNTGDAGANLGGFRGSHSQDAEANVAPVLEGVSEAELEAFVGKLRTDKNRIIAPAAAERRSRGELDEERLHRSRPRVSSMAMEEVASLAWYVGLGAKASGPHDLEALKGYWERGELGPDSLCWREGFGAWVPLCQVPELAEALAPLPQERLPAPEAVPTGDAAAPASFELKGAEALRVLGDEDDPFPELDLEAARVDLSAPISTREPVLGFVADGGVEGFVDPRTPGSGFVVVEGGTAGHAEVRTGAEGAGFAGVASGSASVAPYSHAEAGSPSVDPVGTHAVLATPREHRGEVRWRGALWLAILGGVSGGVAVAVVLALLGSGDGRALLARFGSRDAVGSFGGVTAPGGVQAETGATPGSVPGAGGSVLPGVVGAGAMASPGTVGAGGSATPGIVGAGATASPGTVGAGATVAPGVAGAGATASPGVAGAGVTVSSGVSGAGATAAPGAVGTGVGSEPGTVAATSAGTVGAGSPRRGPRAERRASRARGCVRWRRRVRAEDGAGHREPADASAGRSPERLRGRARPGEAPGGAAGRHGDLLRVRRRPGPGRGPRRRGEALGAAGARRGLRP